MAELDLAAAVNAILGVSGRKPFSAKELETALPLLTHAVNETLVARCEAAEAERDMLSGLKDAMVAYAKRIQSALEAEPGQELDKVATERMDSLRSLREAGACSLAEPKVVMAGRNFAVVKMTFPTRKQAETFKTELAAALAGQEGAK